jgi:hypothetical protein
LGRFVVIGALLSSLAIASPARADQPEPAAKSERTPSTGYVLAASSVLPFTIAGTFGLWSARDYSALKDRCAIGDCSAQARDDGATKTLVADVALGVGVLVLAAGIYFILAKR